MERRRFEVNDTVTIELSRDGFFTRYTASCSLADMSFASPFHCEPKARLSAPSFAGATLLDVDAYIADLRELEQVGQELQAEMDSRYAEWVAQLKG